jgi:hypothetical protein
VDASVEQAAGLFVVHLWRAVISKPFDATLKDLAVINPVEFLAEIDSPPALPVRLLNVDLSTVTTATDIVFGLGDPLQEIIHIDAQAGPDADKDRDVMVYNALLYRQYGVPVHSILLLLRRQAQHGNLTGNISYASRPTKGKMDFGYEILRLWERPVEQLLACGLAGLPLACLGRLPLGLSVEEGMRWVVNQIFDRLEREATPSVLERLMTATYILSGMRLDRQQLLALFQGVRAMRESVSYQMIVEEGCIKGMQRTLLTQGREKFGEPNEADRRALLAIDDIDRLDRLSAGLLKVSTWEELLQTL